MKDGKLALVNETDLAAQRVVYTVDGAEYAIRYTDSNGAVLGTVDAPSKSGFLFKEWIKAEGGFTAEWERMANDINADGNVDTADAILLMQYLVGYPIELDQAVADINGDGRISVYDAVCLLRIICE